MLITIACDDEKFRGQLEALLSGQAYQVEALAKAERALEFLRSRAPHLVVVVRPFFRDALPAFLRSVREDAALRALPILCVNPRGSSMDGVACLEAGADDFISRPFNPQIFLARVRTLLRRRIWSGAFREEPATTLAAGDVTVHLISRTVTAGGTPVELTRLQFDLLAHLMKTVDKVFTRQELLEAVWNYPEDVETRTLDKHVETLRRKLGDAGSAIETVHGVGYRLSAPRERARRA